MPSQEDAFFSSFSFLGVDDILRSEGVDASAGDINQLGLSGLGIPDFGWSGGDGAIGVGEGDDLEDEVDLEIKEEVESPQTMDLFLGDADQSQTPSTPSIKKRKSDAEDGLRRKKKKTEASKNGQSVPEKKTASFKDLYPTFRKDAILDFTEILKEKVLRKSRFAIKPLQLLDSPPEPKPTTSVIPIRQVAEEMVRELPRSFQTLRSGRSQSTSDVDADLKRVLQERAKLDHMDEILQLPLDERSYDLVVLSDWENDIIYSASSAPPRAPVPDLQRPLNATLDSGDWTQGIIWDTKTPFKDFTALEIHEPEVEEIRRAAPAAAAVDASATALTEKVKEKEPARRARKKQREPKPAEKQLSTIAQPQREKDLPKDKFNLSNDKAYEVFKDGGRHRVRQTFGQLVVQHAYPAIKLQMPFYKTRLSKSEARSFHRPPLQLPLNTELHFTKVRSSKKKKDKMGRKIGSGDPMERLRRSSDLTLKETGSFVLWEFSEEHPSVMSNFGMGSVLVNYYRKRDEKDEHIPRLDLGEPFILEPADESPFMRFGSVAPGQTVPALYNNLIRAPLFRQKPYSTDFLVIKSTIKGESTYYIRDIKNLFVVGQTFPVVEVPGPNSRKITNTSKWRLQIIACKLLRKASAKDGLKVPRLLKYFPDHGEMQMRAKLKEFMDYHRKGDHAGFWRPKQGYEVLTDAKAMEMIPPENAVLYESMQVGQRHLQDAGYSRARVSAVDGKQGKLSIEQQLAPWIATKNFINATQNKSMVAIHGEGDPTGRGEGFSFIWVSMKDPFKPLGYVEDADDALPETDVRNKHKYRVAENQTTFKKEIERAWQAQYKALSSKVEPELTEKDTTLEDVDELFGGAEEKKSKIRAASSVAGLDYGREESPMALDGGTPRRSASVFSQTVGQDGESQAAPTGKVLRIKRLGSDGQWRTEIIRDRNVMTAYLAKKHEEEFTNTALEDIVLTGNPEIDAMNRKRLEDELAKRNKNKERRLQRKGNKITNGPNKTETTRKCGVCGQMGHMKTNKKCPMYVDTGAASSPPAMSPPASGAGSTGLNSRMMSPVPFRGRSLSLAGSPPGTGEFGGGGAAPKVKLTLKSKKTS